MRMKPVVAVTFGVGLILVSLNIWSIRFIETKNCDNVLTSSNVNASSSDNKRPLIYAAFGRKVYLIIITTDFPFFSLSF